MRYSVQLRGRIFVKGYGFLPFAKTMVKHDCMFLSCHVRVSE